MSTIYADSERDYDKESRQHKARVNEFCTQLANDFATLLSLLDAWKDERPTEPEQRSRNAVVMGRHLRIVHAPKRATGPRTRGKGAKA